MPIAPPAPAAPAAGTAPAPKPSAAPPKPETSPDAGIPPERPTKDYMGEIEEDLDRLSEEGDAAAEGRKPKAKDAAKPKDGDKKPEGEKPAGQEEELDELADEPPKPPAKKEDEPEPTKIADLRTAYRDLKKWRKENEPKLSQVQTLEARVKELETSGSPEVKTLQERLKSAETRRDELEAEIAHVNYSKSAEYQEKFVKPYQQAWQDALTDLKELEVELADGKTRKATEDDLIELANLPLGKARVRANELFGDSADDMMAHRREIIRLAKAQEDAMEEARKKASERSQESERTRKEQAETTQRAWGETKTALAKRWPNMFDKSEADPDGNKLLEKGQALADRLFAPTKETAPKTPEEAIRLHALIWHKIANHDRLAYRLKKAAARIKELETSLTQYEESDPSGGLRGEARHAAGNGDPNRDAEAEIDELDRKGI